MSEDKVDSSMLWWWPRVKHLAELNIPMSKTVICELTKEEQKLCWEMVTDGVKDTSRIDTFREDIEDFVINEVIPSGINYPMFMRTDLTSSKHNWENTCYVEKHEDLFTHVFRLIEDCECMGMMGLAYRALIFREFLELDTGFKAFRGYMPIAAERRYFAKDGEVICYHNYWPKDSISWPYKRTGRKNKNGLGYEIIEDKPDDWEKQYNRISVEKDSEVAHLSTMARQISKRLIGSWSIDFARGLDGTWYFIDAAQAYHSYHMDGCKWKEHFENERNERIKKGDLDAL